MGKIDIDYIIRFENLNEDYKVVQEKIGIKRNFNITIKLKENHIKILFCRKQKNN